MIRIRERNILLLFESANLTQSFETLSFRCRSRFVVGIASAALAALQFGFYVVSPGKRDSRYDALTTCVCVSRTYIYTYIAV